MKIKLLEKNVEVGDPYFVRDDDGEMIPSLDIVEKPIYKEVEVEHEQGMFYQQLEAVIKQCSGGEWSDYCHEEDYFIEEVEKLRVFSTELINKIRVSNYEKILTKENIKKFDELVTNAISKIIAREV